MPKAPAAKASASHVAAPVAAVPAGLLATPTKPPAAAKAKAKAKTKFQVSRSDSKAIAITGRPTFVAQKKLDVYLRTKHEGDKRPDMPFPKGQTFQQAGYDRSHAKPWETIRSTVRQWANAPSGSKAAQDAEKFFHRLYGKPDRGARYPHDVGRSKQLRTMEDAHLDRMQKLLATAEANRGKGDKAFLPAVARLAKHLNTAYPNLRVGHSKTNQTAGARPDLNVFHSPGGTQSLTPNSRAQGIGGELPAYASPGSALSSTGTMRPGGLRAVRRTTASPGTKAVLWPGAKK